MESLGVQNNFEERLSTSTVKYCQVSSRSSILRRILRSILRRIHRRILRRILPLCRILFLRYLECYFVSSGDSMSCIGSRKLEDLINLEDVLMMLLGW